MGLNSKHGALHAQQGWKFKQTSHMLGRWSLYLWQVASLALAMEEHDDMDSVSVGDSHSSSSTNTESESSSNKSCSSSSYIKTVSC